MCNYYSAWVLLFELQILKAIFILLKANQVSEQSF